MLALSLRCHPITKSKTDPSGVFHFSKRRNYHLGVTFGICGTSWPEGSEYADSICCILPMSRVRLMPRSRSIHPVHCTTMTSLMTYEMLRSHPNGDRSSI